MLDGGAAGASPSPPKTASSRAAGAGSGGGAARWRVASLGRGRVLDSSEEFRCRRRDHSRRHARASGNDMRGHARAPRRRGRRRGCGWWRVRPQARGPAGQRLLLELAAEALLSMTAPADPGQPAARTYIAAPNVQPRAGSPRGHAPVRAVYVQGHAYNDQRPESS